MKILLSGSTGFLGSALHSFLKEKGYDLVRLVRQEQDLQKDTLFWNPQQQIIDQKQLEGFDAVIHLAGESIAGGRWNEDRKKRILDSRVQGTKVLSSALAKLERPPKVFMCASAIGYYGNRGNHPCTEEETSGEGFLAEVCCEWEKATDPAVRAGIRTLNFRFGVILSPSGGALQKMLTPFKFGLGGVLGSGDQFMSWIALQDVLHSVLHALEHVSLSGPVNVVAPKPVTNREFTQTLGSVLHRPTVCSVPAWALRLLLGQEMADEVLLSSTRAVPKALEQSGYEFLYPDLETYLRQNIK